MPLSTTLTDGLTRKLPPLIPSRHRSTLDYGIAASFIAAAPILGRSKPRAGLGCLLCGGAVFLLTRLTDYSNRGTRPVSMHTRRELDLGLAAFTAVLPQILESDDSREKGFFLAEAALLTAVSNLTKPSGVYRGYRRAA